jgi:threonine aldolase
LDSVQTNIVIIDLKAGKKTAQQIADRFKEKGVLLLAIGPRQLRIVTHLDVTEEGIDRAICVFQEIEIP